MEESKENPVWKMSEKTFLEKVIFQGKNIIFEFFFFFKAPGNILGNFIFTSIFLNIFFFFYSDLR